MARSRIRNKLRCIHPATLLVAIGVTVLAPLGFGAAPAQAFVSSASIDLQTATVNLDGASNVFTVSGASVQAIASGT